MRTWLSTSLTDQETCLDALEEMNATILPDVKNSMQNSTIFASNSLAIVAKVMGILANYKIPGHRKLLGFGGSSDEYPGWLSAGDRRFLQESDFTPNATVAKDGTGTHKTLKEAVAAVPKKSKDRFVIHVKEGEYIENVILDKNKWNVMMFGDGKGKTIISGSLNFIDGTPTFATATVGEFFCYNSCPFLLVLYRLLQQLMGVSSNCGMLIINISQTLSYVFLSSHLN